MGRVVHPEHDFSAMFDEFNRRLDALDTANSVLLTRLTQALGGTPLIGTAGAASTVWPTFAVIANTSATFTLTNQATVFVIYSIQGKITGAGAATQTAGTIQPAYDGTMLPGAASFWDSGITGWNNGTGFGTVVLAAGTHTIDLRSADSGGWTFNYGQPTIFVLLVGG